MVEYIVMRVEKFLFPVDFVVLNMHKDAEIPIILGLPVLATSEALIDTSQGVLTLRVQDEMEVFYMLGRDMAPPYSPYWTGYQVDLEEIQESFFKRFWKTKPTVLVTDARS
ncbi:Reverse transcriptase domain-containing protein [Abeliophyllum distichum]|uniref:Reverse transcriptase domain-containing protein n=1 Tax=Abeliophyllum distichum TaxID=126358 RepID=A0ABD1PF99_9LAMI